MLLINANTKTPTTVFRTEPRPPFKLAPPITHAAIASNSNPSPMIGVPIAVLDEAIIPASPEHRPDIA